VEIRRKIDSNTAELTFTIQPGNGHSISYSTSYDTEGTITVTANYGTNIEGSPATFTLNYDPTLVGLSPQVLTFDMVGYNEPLTVADSASLQNIILYLSYALAALTLLQFILSLFLHKMIGL
jgi:hypothetical protein